MTSPSADPNPFADEPTPPQAELVDGEPSDAANAMDAYNIVSDTVAGVNVRKSDNLFQLKVILVCVLTGVPLGAVAGALLSDPDSRLLGAIGGGFGLGLVAVILGLFGSGIYLMVYRAVRHLQGKHD